EFLRPDGAKQSHRVHEYLSDRGDAPAAQTQRARWRPEERRLGAFNRGRPAKFASRSRPTPAATRCRSTVVGFGGVAHRFDVMSVRVDDERSIIVRMVLRAQSWLAVA